APARHALRAPGHCRGRPDLSEPATRDSRLHPALRAGLRGILLQRGGDQPRDADRDAQRARDREARLDLPRIVPAEGPSRARWHRRSGALMEESVYNALVVLTKAMKSVLSIGPHSDDLFRVERLAPELDAMKRTDLG